MNSYRRTRSAILEGAKTLISAVGLARTNMIEIADTAQVSRATLYNHFRDKGSVVRAMLESEVDRVFQLLDADVSPAEILAKISQEISSDPALATMRETDPGILLQMLTHSDDDLWQRIRLAIKKLISHEEGARIAQAWLISQVLQPITLGESQEQSRLIVSLKRASLG